MVKRIITSAIVIVIASTSLQATWKSWADGNIQSTYTNGALIKTSITTAVTGPSLRVRWEPLQSNINPIHAEAPHMSIGCNGIDIGFGSLSFLSLNEIVKKLKDIASVAPAFAFKMAVDTVCSQCSTIMQDLENVVDQINSLSLDSCKAAQQLGGIAGKQLGKAMNYGIDQGKFKDYYSSLKQETQDQRAFLEKGWNSLKTATRGVRDSMIKSTFYGSLLNNARNKVNPSGPIGNDEFVAIARAIVGDVVFYAPNNKDTFFWIYPIETFDDAARVLVDNENNTALSNNKLKKVFVRLFDKNGGDVTDTISNMPVEKEVDTQDIINNKSWTDLTYKKLNQILEKLNNKQSLSQDDKSFLASLPKNGYLYVNLAHLHRKKYEEKLHIFAKYTAMVNLEAQLKFIILNAMKMTNEYLTQMNPADVDKREIVKQYQSLLRSKSRELRSFFPGKIHDLEKELNDAVSDKNKILRKKVAGQ